MITSIKEKDGEIEQLKEKNEQLTNENARLNTENKRFRALVLETAHIRDDEIKRLEGIIKNIQERNSEMKYQIAFKDWKLGELHCPTCESTDLSPPNQYCTKQYVCKKCSLQFDPVKEYENVELPGLETKDAAPPCGLKCQFYPVCENCVEMPAAPPALTVYFDKELKSDDDMVIVKDETSEECPNESDWEMCGACPFYDAETAECTKRIEKAYGRKRDAVPPTLTVYFDKDPKSDEDMVIAKDVNAHASVCPNLKPDFTCRLNTRVECKCPACGKAHPKYAPYRNAAPPADFFDMVSKHTKCPSCGCTDDIWLSYPNDYRIAEYNCHSCGKKWMLDESIEKVNNL